MTNEKNYLLLAIMLTCLAGCASDSPRNQRKAAALQDERDTGTLETADLQMEQRRLLLQRQ